MADTNSAESEAERIVTMAAKIIRDDIREKKVGSEFVSS